MIYGATGSLDLSVIGQRVVADGPMQMALVFGLVFLVSGLAFKLGAVPFHMWVPDVYGGAPTAVTLALAAAPKLAAFAITMRLLVSGLGALTVDWQQMLMILAVLSLIVGNLTAIMQTNFKRMLAYSTIAHVGFVLLGLMSGSPDGSSAVSTFAYGSSLFYILTYVLTTLGTFGVILLLSHEGFECENIDDLKGLNKRNPVLAGVMLVLMFFACWYSTVSGLLRQTGGLASCRCTGHAMARCIGSGILADRGVLLFARGQSHLLR